MNLSAGQQWSHRHRERTGGHGGGRRKWGKLREQHGNIYFTISKIGSGNLLYDAGAQASAL